MAAVSPNHSGREGLTGNRACHTRYGYHTLYGMKMTMHIDEVLLEKVMESYGLETKTDAVHFALNELDRKARLKAMLKEGLGLPAEAWKDAVYEDYDPVALRVAEDPKAYGASRPD